MVRQPILRLNRVPEHYISNSGFHSGESGNISTNNVHCTYYVVHCVLCSSVCTVQTAFVEGLTGADIV